MKVQRRHGFPVVVHLLVGAGGRVLLLERARTGRADGFWAPPGGHLEAGEWPLEAALRECVEETGVCVPADRARPLATLAFGDGPRGPGLNLLFGARLDAAPDARPAPDSAARVAWCDPAALPTPAVPWLREVLERWTAIEGLGLSTSPWYGEFR
jgi:8-oxo-dGTP pyrophosphatase MutT (NUDIX family)